MKARNSVCTIFSDYNGLPMMFMPMLEILGRLSGDQLGMPGVGIPPKIPVDPDDVHVGGGLVHIVGLIHHNNGGSGGIQGLGVKGHRLEIRLEKERAADFLFCDTTLPFDSNIQSGTFFMMRAPLR